MALLILCFLGCGKPTRDPITLSQAFWVNSSNHVIEINPFSNGNVRLNYKVTLQPGEQIQIADHMSMGIIGFKTYFYSPYLQNDSVQVKFDDQYIVSHYIQPPPTQNRSLKYYLYEPPRNISIITSYEGEIVSKTDAGALYMYIYRFTDQDYLDAQ